MTDTQNSSLAFRASNAPGQNGAVRNASVQNGAPAAATPGSATTARPTGAVAGRTFAGAASEHALRPDADIYEDAEGITVALDLPGVGSDALEIQVDKQSLTVEAEANIDLAEGTQPIHAEVRSRHYRRSFSLSTELEGDRIEANLKDGVLTLHIPKRAEVKPRRVEVRTA
jgi:HSP20 family molecular chaperone IbpA